MNAPFSDLRCEPRTEPVPPGANRFMADIDAAFVEQIFDLPQRERKPDIHHHSQADDLGRRLEISEGIAHPDTLRNPPHRLKLVSSDTALSCLPPSRVGARIGAWRVVMIVGNLTGSAIEAR